MTTPAFRIPTPLRRWTVVPLLLLPAALVAVVAVVLLRGAGSSNANGSVEVGSVEDLRGRWTAVNDSGTPMGLTAPVELDVDGDRLSVRTGCNTGQGRVGVDDSHLVVDGEGLAVTEMGCLDDLARQESWVLDMIGSEPRLELSGPYLGVHWGSGERYWLGFERQDSPG